MHDICHYQLELQEWVDEGEFNATSPLPVRVMAISPLGTCLEVDTDQSGIIGLIRYLHQQGIVLLSLCRTRLGENRFLN